MRLRLHASSFRNPTNYYRVVTRVNCEIRTPLSGSNHILWGRDYTDGEGKYIALGCKQQKYLDHDIESVLIAPFDFTYDDKWALEGRLNYRLMLIEAATKPYGLHLCFTNDLIFEDDDFSWGLTHFCAYVRSKAQRQFAIKQSHKERHRNG